MNYIQMADNVIQFETDIRTTPSKLREFIREHLTHFFEFLQEGYFRDPDENCIRERKTGLKCNTGDIVDSYQIVCEFDDD